MSKLFTFLENLDTENLVKIYEESGSLLFEGKVGDVPQRITNQTSVERGTVENKNGFLIIKVRKH